MLLLLGAAADEHAHRADGGMRAKGDRGGKASLRQFLHHHAQARFAEPRTSVLGRDGDRGQTRLGHLGQQLARHPVLAFDLRRQGPDDIVGKTAGQIPQQGQFFGQSVHGKALLHRPLKGVRQALLGVFGPNPDPFPCKATGTSLAPSGLSMGSQSVRVLRGGRP